MEFDLVFEGGGAKGMVFVGAMQAFNEAGHTVGRLLGTSAGAITATLLAAGYTREEMLEALVERENGKPVFAGFMGVPGPFSKAQVSGSAIAEFFTALDIPFVPGFVEEKIDDAFLKLFSSSEKFRHLFSFIERGGWYSATRFRTWIEDKMNSGVFDGKPRNFGGMTLQQFYHATKKELGLIATDTSGQQMLILNHRTAPQCPVVWAVRMSMSIPLVWQEVEWQESWGKYRDQDLTGHLIVDGGMLSNFPIELFYSDAKHITDVMGDKSASEIIGLLIDEQIYVADAPPLHAVTAELDMGNLKTIQRLKGLIDTMTTAHDKRIIDVLSDLVVRLPAKGFGTTEFDMSDARRNALLAAGKEEMKKYLNRRAARMGMEASPSFEELNRVQMVATKFAEKILEIEDQ